MEHWSDGVLGCAQHSTTPPLQPRICYYCRSYSPLFTRLRTVKPAFFASLIETVLGELNVDHTRRTGFLQAGHLVKGLADSGRRKVNFPPHTTQFPSQSSYSYKGISGSLSNATRPAGEVPA